MKATKKIVGAACALVAAVALSAGSTFAWFATNNEVTADGMHVQASAPTNLYIESGYIASADGVNKTTISVGKSVSALNPAAISTSAITTGSDGAADTITTNNGTVSNGLNIVEAKEYSTEPGANVAGTASKYKLLGTLTPNMTASPAAAVWAGEQKGADASVTYQKDSYLLAADMTVANKSEAIDLSAKVTISWTNTVTTQIYKFLRVGYLVGTPTVEESGTTWSYEFVSLANDITTNTTSKETDTGTNYVYDGSARTVTVENANLVTSFAQNSVRTITFLAWLDGADSECYVNNIVSVSELSLSISFTAAAATTSGGAGGGAGDQG